MCEGLAKAVDVGTRPIGQAIDDTGSGADQGLARCRAGDAPDFTIFFPDHLGTIHGPQRSAHLLPQVTLKRVRPQELGDRDPDTPVELPAKGGLLVKGDLLRADPADVGVLGQPLPAFLTVFVQLSRRELAELVGHRYSVALLIASLPSQRVPRVGEAAFTR